MKRTLITSLLVSALVIFPSFPSNFAHAEDEDEQVPENNEINDMEIPNGIFEPSNEEGDEIEIDIDTPASVTGETMEGSGTVVDFTTSGAKAFYTIVDNEQKVFYLIIDMDKTENNVYFLSDINRTELDPSATAEGEAAAPAPSNNDVENIGVGSSEAEAEPEAETEDSNMGFLLIVLVLAIVGVGGYYFLNKKKQNKNSASQDDVEMEESYEDNLEEDFYQEEPEAEENR
ncbi:DUF4366 domain-containing protein [Shouchella clausii]|uniref:CD1107 family mobile element protein n=1 Tax=Shouchella clausii TaxID=79880 RepID=UPI0026F4119B|nr:DUF4366 domain-containing protein [Shouchella clausii]MDO7285909.1 DUF4366 domain-containing protein [Shouchella clausii]MDO7305812.1 DUF4366 domain-containing protein [Shouchella clausii]